MAERILALGISGLPNPIKCIGWDEIEKGLKVNVSDYNIVFIDFSYFIKDENPPNLINKCLNPTKFFEVIESGIDIFILGISAEIYHKGNWYNLYSWLPDDIISIGTITESGEIVKCLNKPFLDYFNLLKNWVFYFYITQNVSDKNPYLYDINDLAINNADKKLGFEISNFKRIFDMDLYQSYINEGRETDADTFVEKYKGKLYLLPTLKNNSANGILSILEKVYHFSFSRKKPTWTDKIQTKKSSIITEEMKKLFEEKQKIESEITRKFSDIENIEYFKQLLWQVGTELEEVVHESVKLIGLLPSSPTKADDDGILNYKNEEYVLEIKSGLEHGASFTELSKLITRMESRKKMKSKDCKGIFIMNHFANFPLKDRGEPFPPNVRGTAKVNNVKLITTEQLFNIIKLALDGEISAADAQKQFFSL